jgi:amino acid adenylation domain-containing protein/thioester reductase-like protein
MSSSELSPAQERMWFLERLHPGTAAYNVSSAVRFRGCLASKALDAAFMVLLRRHDAMRSFFPLDGERPRRMVENEPRAVVERVTAYKQRDGELPLEELERFARRPFDVVSGPLVRAALVSVAEDDHVLLIVLHHLISDGWSLGVIHTELAALYNATVRGEACVLTQMESDYAEYVRWEHAQAEHDHLADGLAFWRERLAGLEMLELPGDRPRPAIQTLRGARRIAYLPQRSVQRLEALARSCSSSLFMALQAAFAVLLYRCTAQRDIAIGSPIANRQSNADGVVGLFVNTIVLRCKLEDGLSFAELLKRERDPSLEAIERGNVPFERVVEELHPERGLSHNPLFQVMFALQGPEAELPAFDGLQATLLDLDLGSTRFDLECTTWREPHRLKVRLTYSRDIFDGATAERLLSYYIRLLESIGADPHTPIESFELLAGHEREYLLERRRVLRHPDLDSDVPTLFEAQAERSPGSIALETADRGLSYGELAAAAKRVAGALRSLGVGSNDIVGVRTSRGADMITAMLAVMMSGAALLPLDPEEPAERTRLLLADSGTGTVLTDDPCRTVSAGGVRWVEVGEALAAGEGRRGAPTASPNRLAYLIYTSGTSGRPKGVLVEHRNVVNTLVGCREWFGFDAGDLFLCLASPTFDIFYFELLSPLLCGGCARLVSREELFDPARLAPLVRRATVMQAVPGLMKQILEMLRVHEGPTPVMRHAITGGDTVPVQLAGMVADIFPQAQVTILYGPTEATMVCSGIALPDPRAVHSHPIGGPLPNVVLRVYDDRRQLVPIGVAGEIYIGGAGVSRGYLGASLEFADRYIEIDGERFYRSGDRGRWRADGCLEFLGRLDEQMKVHGFRIEPAEIEAAIESLPDMREAAVVACGEHEMRRLLAYVVPTQPLPERGGAEQRHIADWRALFDQAHAGSPHTGDEHDFTGWHSSSTRAPLPRAQMEDWLSGCLAEISMRLPSSRRNRARILEIGCGTGLLLFALAPRCERYVGTDFAPRTLAAVRARVRERGWRNVELYDCVASAVSEFEDGQFDAVILNSVAQYFPGIEYLTQIVDRAIRCLCPGGFVFVGDVRNLALHELFLAGLEFRSVPGALGGKAPRELLRKRVENERELLVHPAYFASLLDLEEVAHVDIPLRRGHLENEMLQYRYNAVVYTAGECERARVLHWVDWEASGLTLEQALERLARERPHTLALCNVPNGLLSEDLLTWASALDGVREAAPQANAVRPADLREHAERIGYELALSWARGAPDGRFDAVLSAKRDDEEPPPRWVWPRGVLPERPANNPVEALLRSEAVARVQLALKEQLPTYMVPSDVRIVDTLPTCVNGKLDRAALVELASAESALERLRRGGARGQDGPATVTEHTLARAWAEVLGVDVSSRHANFFATGGTSLLAIRVAVRLKSHGVDVSAQDLFRHQTVASLAAALDARLAGGGETLPGPVREPSHEPIHNRTVGPGAGSRNGLGAERRNPDAPLANAESVLLTGATGFLGIHLLRDLLEETGARVTCLVRASDQAHAEQRIHDQWQWHFGDAEPPLRLEVLVGDIAQSGLGMDPGAHRSLARICQHVIHAAADVRHVGDRSDIFRANLEGTHNVLEFVVSARRTSLHHVSTIGVKGMMTDGTERCFTERDLDIGQSPTEEYSASKLAAERAVRAFLDAGGSGTVLRVGTVAPHSITGRFKRDGIRKVFMRGFGSTLDLELGSDWPGRFYALAPVDSLARAIVTLADLGAPGRETFHVSTPHVVTHYQLIQVLQTLGYRIRVVDSDEFVKRALCLARDPRLEDAVGGVVGLIDPSPGRHVQLDASWTHAKLRAAGFEFPPPTSAWLARFIAHCVNTGSLPAPVHWGAVHTLPEILTSEPAQTQNGNDFCTAREIGRRPTRVWSNMSK